MARALRDLESVANYLRMEAPAVESRMVLEIYEAVGSLAQMPLKGRQTDRTGVRELTLFSIHYKVIYRVTARSVQILRIRHTSRRPLKD